MDIAARATDWYAASARDLPWRRPGTSPWAVLVSEIMLQQTPVARVEPAWRAWLDRWPTPGDLARSSPGDAVRMWGKLGYPRRALRLHECAVVLDERHGGQVPSDVDTLLGLAGVGAYTARAVAVFAFGQRHAVVDTNVRRVVARSVLGRAEPAAPSTTRDLREALALLPTDPPSAARAAIALMELGALVCTARAPRCPACPLVSACAWRRAGSPPAGGPPAVGRARAAGPGYAGTDRQVRGRLLDVLRAAPGPVPATALDLAWPEPTQRARALASLVTDGLIAPRPDGAFALPGSPEGRNGTEMRERAGSPWTRPELATDSVGDYLRRGQVGHD